MTTSVPGNILRFKLALLAGLSLAVIAFDQWTKSLIHSRFRWGESVNVIQNLFAFTYVRNTGAAFGLLHRAPSWFRDPFFIVVPVVALFVIIFILVTLPPDQKKAVVGLSLVFGGAIGNLIDRLRFGYVIDFVDLHWKEIYHWPAFNVADSSIVVGVGLMFVLSLFQGKSQVTPSQPLSHTASAGK